MISAILVIAIMFLIFLATLLTAEINRMHNINIIIENQRNNAVNKLSIVTERNYFFDDNNDIQIWNKYPQKYIAKKAEHLLENEPLKEMCVDQLLIVERIYSKLFDKYSGDKMKALAETCFKFYAIEIDASLVPIAREKIYKLITAKMDEEFDYKQFTLYLLAYILQEKIECKDFFKVMKQWGRNETK